MHRPNAGAARSGTRGGEHWIATILNEAYKVLRGEKTRATYDKELFERYTKNPESAEGSGKTPLSRFFVPSAIGHCRAQPSKRPGVSIARARYWSLLLRKRAGIAGQYREQRSPVKSPFMRAGPEKQASPNHGSIAKGNAV